MTCLDFVDLVTTYLEGGLDDADRAAFEEHLALHRMDCMAASGNLENWEFVRERREATPEEAVRPRPLLTGRELIAEGYQPGAAFKAMLRAVEDAQLEGAIATPEEALRLVRERFPRP